MNFDFNNDQDCKKARYRLEKLISSKSKANLTKKIETRSTQQNRALHKLFAILSDQLNELGETYKYIWLDEVMELSFTPELIKESLWRKIQLALFNKQSTKDLTTNEINQIIDILALKFSEWGIPVNMPNKLDYLQQKEYEQKYKSF